MGAIWCTFPVTSGSMLESATMNPMTVPMRPRNTRVFAMWLTIEM